MGEDFNVTSFCRHGYWPVTTCADLSCVQSQHGALDGGSPMSPVDFKK